MAHYLKLDGIPGDSVSELHPNTIEVHSWSWGETNPISIGSATSGAGAGKVSFNDFHVTMPNNKASVDLFLACASGKHIPCAELFVTHLQDGKPTDYLIIKMSIVFVRNYNISGHSEGANPDQPMEEITLTFGKCEIERKMRDSSGKTGPSMMAGWDIVMNRQI